MFTEDLKFKDRTPISARYGGNEIRSLDKLKYVGEFQGMHTERSKLATKMI